MAIVQLCLKGPDYIFFYAKKLPLTNSNENHLAMQLFTVKCLKISLEVIISFRNW